jgi:hypothetical protein
MEETTEPLRRLPSELAAVAPPHVQLTDSEPDQGTRPRKMAEDCCNDEVRHGAEKTVEEHFGTSREHGVIEVRAPAIVVRPQVQREPKMLRNVIEEC